MTGSIDTASEPRRREQLAGPLLLVGIAVAGVVALVWPDDEPTFTPVEALVITSTPCTAPDAHDRVRFDLGGRTIRADLNGCGNRVGSTVPVEVPDTGETESLTVRLEGTHLGGDPQEHRLGAVLFVGAGLGGAFLGWQLRGRAEKRHP